MPCWPRSSCTRRISRWCWCLTSTATFSPTWRAGWPGVSVPAPAAISAFATTTVHPAGRRTVAFRGTGSSPASRYSCRQSFLKAGAPPRRACKRRASAMSAGKGSGFHAAAPRAFIASGSWLQLHGFRPIPRTSSNQAVNPSPRVHPAVIASATATLTSDTPKKP